MAHNGPAFGLDWHPEEKQWLATCGRDKIIKVCSLDNQLLLPQNVALIHFKAA